MTAEEKVLELLMKFETVISPNGYDGKNEIIKQCALICVDEILKVAFYTKDVLFYQQVKNEIEKL